MSNIAPEYFLPRLETGLRREVIVPLLDHSGLRDHSPDASQVISHIRRQRHTCNPRLYPLPSSAFEEDQGCCTVTISNSPVLFIHLLFLSECTSLIYNIFSSTIIFS